MFTNVRYGSNSNSEKNIDVCGVQEHSAWVIDGADALFSAHISDCASDGAWFVRELNLYLKKNLSNKLLSIDDIMRQGLKDIHKEYQKFKGATELFDLEMPNACCAVVRVHQNMLSYFILGNCELILTYGNKTTTISDLRLQELDAKLLEISQDARTKQRMPLFQARKFVDNMLVENRLRRNIENGYYVLSEDSDVIDHALKGSLPLTDAHSISLICNGFSQYFNCKKVVHNLENYLQKTRNEELVQMYDNLLLRKKNNANLARYMQNKMSGQSTMVYFDIENTKQIRSSNEEVLSH